jgi:predicted ATPase/class 3 adenylate cyclase
LQVHVSKLRKKLSAAGAGENVSSAPQGYVLRTGPDEVDVEQFEQLANAATGDPAEISTRLREALSFWRGPALADVSSDLLAGEKTRLEELRLLVLERCIEADLAMGCHLEVVGELEALVQADPLREGTRRQLMLALYRSGRQADALATYRAAREILAEELGIDPGPQLQALELAILNQDPDIAAPVGASSPSAPVSSASKPPSGTLTLLMTDIEGSTRLWEEHPEAMAIALRRHDALVRAAIEGCGGYVFKTVGDAFCAAFSTAKEATEAAEAVQRVLIAEPWPDGATVRVRMALHTGECEERDGDYFGPAVNRVARLTAIGHGGQVLVSRPTADVVSDHLPAGVSLRDMGTHHLRDLSRPEVVFQLEIDGLPSEFPPLRSLDNPALLNNLPMFVSSFVGRDAEMIEVRKLVSDNRLVTLTGAGGAGKTRLAIQVAAELLDGTGDGVWLVELASATDNHAVPTAVASALGVAERPGQDTLDTLVDVLTGQHRLMVLDNCEHVLDACAAMAQRVVSHCPKIHVLATSREPLHIDGEVVYRVPPLSLPPEDVEDVDLGGSGAMALFVDRASTQVPGFALHSDDVALIASICRRLDGMPLAIELATARLRSMSPRQLHDRLEHRFDLLTGGSRVALPRQQTLRALVDWSYDLLTEREQILLRRLSVFIGGFDLEAAEAIGALDDQAGANVVDLLTSLVEKSLVQAEHSGRIVRYVMLETLRQYGVERVAEAGDSEAERLRAAHAAYYLGYVEEAAPHLAGPLQADWLARLEKEYPNLQSAAEHFLGVGDVVRARRLFGMARRYWWCFLHTADTIRLLDRALLEDVDYDGTGRVTALLCLSHILRFADIDRGVRCAFDAVDAARQTRDRALEAEALGLLCFDNVFRGTASEGRGPGTQALALARELGDPVLLGQTLLFLAQATPWDATDAVEPLYLEGLRVVQKSHDAFIEMFLRGCYGAFLVSEDRLTEARQQLGSALVLARTMSPRLVTTIIGELGFVMLSEGDLLGAGLNLRKAVREYWLTGDAYGAAEGVLGLARCASSVGDDARAATLYGGADALLDELPGGAWSEDDLDPERDMAQLRGRMKGEFERYYDEGRSMSPDEVVDLALGHVEG